MTSPGGPSGGEISLNVLRSKSVQASNSGTLRIGLGGNYGARITVTAGEDRQRRMRFCGSAHLVPMRLVEGRQLLKCKAACAAGLKAGCNFRRFDHECARAAHGIVHWFIAIKVTEPKHQRRHGFAHRRLGGCLLVAPPVQQIARCVDAESAEIILESDLEREVRLVGNLRAQCCGYGVGDALGGSARMVDAGTLAACLHPQRNIISQGFRPWEGAGALVQLRQMKRPEFPDPRQHPAGAAQLQVGAPDIAPVAHESNAAGHLLGRPEAFLVSF